jgi:hypothetical protein
MQKVTDYWSNAGVALHGKESPMQWAARDSNPARRIKSPELYQMS